MPWQPGKHTNKPTNMQTVQRVADSGNSASSCGRRFAAVERAHEEVSKRAPVRVRVRVRVRACVCVGLARLHLRGWVGASTCARACGGAPAGRSWTSHRRIATCGSFSSCSRLALLDPPSPGADVGGASRVPVQMWQRRFRDALNTFPAKVAHDARPSHPTARLDVHVQALPCTHPCACRMRAYLSAQDELRISFWDDAAAPRPSAEPSASSDCRSAPSGRAACRSSTVSLGDLLRTLADTAVQLARMGEAEAAHAIAPKHVGVAPKRRDVVVLLHGSQQQQMPLPIHAEPQASATCARQLVGPACVFVRFRRVRQMWRHSRRSRPRPQHSHSSCATSTTLCAEWTTRAQSTSARSGPASVNARHDPPRESARKYRLVPAALHAARCTAHAPACESVASLAARRSDGLIDFPIR